MYSVYSTEVTSKVREADSFLLVRFFNNVVFYKCIVTQTLNGTRRLCLLLPSFNSVAAFTTSRRLALTTFIHFQKKYSINFH